MRLLGVQSRCSFSMLINCSSQGKRNHQDWLELERAGSSPIAVYNSSDKSDLNHSREGYLAKNVESSERILSCKKANTHDEIVVDPCVLNVTGSRDNIMPEDKEEKFIKRIVNDCRKNMIAGTPRTRVSSILVFGELDNKGYVSSIMATARAIDSMYSCYWRIP